MEIRLTLGRKNLLVDFSSRAHKCIGYWYLSSVFKEIKPTISLKNISLISILQKFSLLIHASRIQRSRRDEEDSGDHGRGCASGPGIDLAFSRFRRSGWPRFTPRPAISPKFRPRRPISRILKPKSTKCETPQSKPSNEVISELRVPVRKAMGGSHGDDVYWTVLFVPGSTVRRVERNVRPRKSAAALAGTGLPSARSRPFLRSNCAIHVTGLSERLVRAVSVFPLWCTSIERPCTGLVQGNYSIVFLLEYTSF